MARVIAVTNLKGGIGKTTTVVSIGAGLALKGARVLLVDVDAQGNLAMALGVQPRRTLYEVLIDGTPPDHCLTRARPNLDMLAADVSLLTAQPELARRPDWSQVLARALHPIRRNYDAILIDCGGSLTILNVNALVFASDLLVPTAVEPLSIRGIQLLERQIASIRGLQARIRLIVPTMFDPRVRQAHDLLAALRQTYGAIVTEPVRVNVRLSEAPGLGRTIYEYDPRSRGAVDYARIVEQISAILNLAARTAAPAPAGATPPPPPSSSHQEMPLVTGAIHPLHEDCPQCGHPLQQATLAGYRVAYCDHCHYKRQTLAHGVRR